eukprot:350597-Chlamydomonas_euryale.AAC.2
MAMSQLMQSCPPEKPHISLELAQRTPVPARTILGAWRHQAPGRTVNGWATAAATRASGGRAGCRKLDPDASTGGCTPNRRAEQAADFSLGARVGAASASYLLAQAQLLCGAPPTSHASKGQPILAGLQRRAPRRGCRVDVTGFS